jgi:hypothetical protein
MFSLPPITLRLRGWKLIDRVALAFLLSFTLVSGGLCRTAQAAQTQGKKSQTEQEDDIREAVLQKLMQDWVRDLDKDEAEAKNAADKESARHYNFRIFFIEINEKDPTDEFLKRFVNIPRTLKRVSDADVRKTTRMPVVDKGTGERGIIFRVDSVRWRGTGHAKVEGGYHCDGLCGAGYTFDVRFEKDRWIVKKQKKEWIS